MDRGTGMEYTGVSGRVGRVICIAGSTASGKTALALQLARRYPLALISVDSGQVYRGLDIGTAKLSAELLVQYPHGLVDTRTIIEPFSAADFCSEAMAIICRAWKRQQVPLLVGGTLFYFSALLNGLGKLPTADHKLRGRILRRALLLGWPALHDQLQRRDPDAAARIDPNDSQRIQRALEINLLTGQPVPAGNSAAGLLQKGVEVLQLALAVPDRSVLHQRITRRFDAMLAAGLVDEVAAIRQTWGDAETLPAMRSVGYRQVWRFLSGDLQRRQMRDSALAATRQLAKRQLTWLRNSPGQIWFDATDPDLVSGSVLRYLAATGMREKPERLNSSGTGRTLSSDSSR